MTIDDNMRFRLIVCLFVTLFIVFTSNAVSGDTSVTGVCNAVYTELGGNLFSAPLSLNYERLVFANENGAVICRAELSAMILLKLVNAGAIVGYSIGRQNAWELNLGISNELYSRIPDLYSNYKTGYKLSNGLYYRHYGQNGSLFRIGISSMYNLTNQSSDQSNWFPIVGVSYGFSWP